MTAPLFSFLMDLLWLIMFVAVSVGGYFAVKSLLRRLGRRANCWTPYTRTLKSTGQIEVGVRRGDERLALETTTARLVSADPDTLYELQARADETAASLNARKDQHDY